MSIIMSPFHIKVYRDAQKVEKGEKDKKV